MVDLSKGHENPQRKMPHIFFEIISLESQQKCWHQHFSEKKEGKDISSQVFLEFVFAYRKANAFINVLKLMVT